MPIEIKELHIKVTINATDSSQPSGRGGSRSTASTGDEDRDALIAECVEQVMQLLQAKKER